MGISIDGGCRGIVSSIAETIYRKEKKDEKKKNEKRHQYRTKCCDGGGYAVRMWGRK